MKADDLKLEELVTFAEGRLNLAGRRLVLHDMRAFADMREDLCHMLGPEQTQRVFTRFGFFWGQADAAAMKRIFSWDSVVEWVKAGPRLHSLQGVAKSVVKSLRLQEDGSGFHMQVIWEGSGEAAEHVSVLNGSPTPVCWMLVGYASGYASFCTGREILFIEKKCAAKGDPVCTAIGMERKDWGDEIEPHLPYFKAEDIQEKIEQLTRELRQKSFELETERKRYRQHEVREQAGLHEVHSPAYAKVMDLAQRVAAYDTTILITGETGTGKEVLARYIHKLSNRAGGQFLAINCSALPDTLLESELFGHTAGAFTGALHDRAGLLEQAAGGTLFLDEVGDVSPALQARLLRAVQEKEVLRIGESKPRRIDVRIMAATNRDLAAAIQDGSFREDLFYRLAVVEIHVPPLRRRTDDILSLARYFVSRFAKNLNITNLRLDASSLDCLLRYSWPGNVRELENAIERAAVLSDDGLILPENLPNPIRLGISRLGSGESRLKSLAEIEMNHIRNVLDYTGGNRTAAAKILSISPATLWRKLKPDASRQVE